MAQHDMVIRSGSVIDGTGQEAFTADVAIKDGLVVEVGKVSGVGRREVDADGALVTPGFVDIHTHLMAKRLGPIACHRPVIMVSPPL